MRAESKSRDAAAAAAARASRVQALRAWPARRDAGHPAANHVEALADRERAKRLAKGLVGQAIPALVLQSSNGVPMQLERVANPAAVLYLYPAATCSPNGRGDSDSADGAQHRALDRHRDDLRAHTLTAIGISSEPERTQRERVLEHQICHQLASDPGLQLAQALGLPTFTQEGVRCYRRLTIVAFTGLIVKAFFPVDSPQRSAAQVICWLKVTGR